MSEDLTPAEVWESQIIPPQPTDRHAFHQRLASLLNEFSYENGSNTPDYILAQYMRACLDAFNQATREREAWYGRIPR